MRISILQYALTVGFDLLYVGVLRWGPKGIPLAMVTSLALTVTWAYRKNLCDLRSMVDRGLRVFFAKNLLAAGLAAASVAGLEFFFPRPATGLGNFSYLVATCGFGSVVFFAALFALKAISLSQFWAVGGDSNQA